MTDAGDYILVDCVEAQTELPALLKAVSAGRHVRIFENGKTVAELQPPSRVPDRLQMHPKQFNEDPAAPLIAEVLPVPEPRLWPTNDPDLKVTFSPEYDPTEGLSEDDWPEHLR